MTEEQLIAEVRRGAYAIWKARQDLHQVYRAIKLDKSMDPAYAKHLMNTTLSESLAAYERENQNVLILNDPSLTRIVPEPEPTPTPELVPELDPERVMEVPAEVTPPIDPPTEPETDDAS
jgi:hypothetical protein